MPARYTPVPPELAQALAALVESMEARRDRLAQMAGDIRSLAERLDHGVFGYTRRPGGLDEALVSWFARRHGWTIAPEEILEALFREMNQ